MKKELKLTIIALAIFAVLAAAFAAIYFVFLQKPVEGDKSITVTVIHANGTEKVFEINTDAGTLRAALEEKNLISGDEGEYGLFVTVVDGETADTGKTEWWNFSKDGTALFTPVDTTVIADGENYEITFTVGW